MNNQEIIKNVFEEFFYGDLIEDAFTNSYIDEQIKNSLKKAIEIKEGENIDIINGLDEQVKNLKREIKDSRQYHKEQIEAIQKKIGKDVSEL